MKKVFCFVSFLCLCFCSLFFCACSKNQTPTQIAETQATTNQLDAKVAEEISSIENIETYSDETIKALSVIVRTNLSNNINSQTEYDANNYIYNNEYIINNNHILELVKQTSGETIKTNSEKTESFEIKTNASTEAWELEIKKSKILEFMKKNNISLSNISNFNIVKDESGNIKKLEIGSKEFFVEDLIDAFDLPSVNITDIKNKKTTVLIKGFGNKNDFDINKSESFAKEGQNYKKILKKWQNNFQIITNNQK